MAKFTANIDDSVLKDIQYIDKDFERIFGGMTQEAAKVVMNNVKNSMPSALKKSLSSENVKISKIYKTPTDDGINTKVMITGYFINEDGRKTILSAWQKRKQETIRHPFLEETVPVGLIPHVQAKLLARVLRGELDEYPPIVWR